MSRRPGLFTAQTREREPLPIVSPSTDIGDLLGNQLLTGEEPLVALPCETEAVYIFCESLIHFSTGHEVTIKSPPIDARGGTYLAVDRGAVARVRLMAGKDPAECWIHNTK